MHQMLIVQYTYIRFSLTYLPTQNSDILYGPSISWKTNFIIYHNLWGISANVKNFFGLFATHSSTNSFSRNHSNTHVLMVPDHFSYLLINSIKQSKMFALSLEIALYCSIMAKSRFSAFSAENVYIFLP